MAENLADFMEELEETEPGPFSPGSHYYGFEEDSLMLYLRNEESLAHRINSLVTVFLSPDAKRLVGCQVKGLRRKLFSDGHLAISITRNGKLQLGLFFHLLAYDVTEQEPRNRLVDLAQEAKGIEVDTSELVSC